LNKWPALLLLVLIPALGCGDDENNAAPPQASATGKSIIGTQDYTWVDILLTGYPAGSQLSLRTNYWSRTELNEDPFPSVVALDDDIFRVQFSNLSSGSFLGLTAAIRMVVKDSAGDDLSGVVVLCEDTGPFIMGPCAGDCDPLCGIDDCAGCNGDVCR